MRFLGKKETTIYFSASLLLLLTLGIGIAIVYSDYIYTPNKGFTFMNISSSDIERVDVADGVADPDIMEKYEKEAKALSDDLDRWAEEHQASILIRDVIPRYPHISVSLYSDLVLALKIETTGNDGNGLFIEKELLSDTYFLENNLFLPHQYRQPIEGIYDKEGLPKPLQQQGYFLLSLKAYPLPPGIPYISQLYTDAEDVSGIQEILKQYRIGSSNVQRDESKPADRLKSLFYPIGFYNGVLLLTLSAAMGGFVFLTFMQLRNPEAYRIRHLCGKPLFRIAADIGLMGLGLFIISFGILWWLFPRFCSYMLPYDMIRIRQWTGYILLSIVVLSYTLAISRLLWKLRRR